MDFSRLSDTKFPNLETASPYALKNTFDYTRWVPNTRVHLVNVLWGEDYTNVVKFNTNAERDAWFDSITDKYELTLTSNARIVPDGTIKLPLPYDVAVKYNYLYVDIPIATSTGSMIQNETDDGIRRWFFFIGGVSYSAPNTTVMFLQNDVWTNFINDARLTYMLLSRGHAPVAASDTDEYLANPIENNKYLLAPDVNFDDSDVVKDSKFIPFGNGKKYICIASTVGYKQIKDGELGTITGGASWSMPTYSDTEDWFGYQLQVNGYDFGNGSDYTQLRAPVNMYNRPDSRMPTGLDVYAVPADDSSFLNDINLKTPAFLRTIKAIFVADENMITLGGQLTLVGHTIYYCTGVDKTLDDYELEKNMFGFSDEIQRFAKLYTYPYSRIEVSDNTGKVTEVRIENTGKIGMRLLTSVAFPILDFRVLLTGINGVGSESYTWKNLEGTEFTKLMPNGDWDKFSFEFDIPTFALYMDAEVAWYLDSYSSSVSQARRNALVEYHKTVRSANLGYTNNKASADTAYGNAKRQADTVETNAKAANKTANDNAQDSADTVKTNAEANADCAYTNALNSANCVKANVDTVISTNNSNKVATSVESTLVALSNQSEQSKITVSRNALISATTREENHSTTATTATSNQYGVAGNVLSGAASGAMFGSGLGSVAGLPGAAAGAAVGILLGTTTATINTLCGASNAEIITNANTEIADATRTSNLECQAYANTNAADVNKAKMDLLWKQIDNENGSLASQRDKNYETAKTNAGNAQTTLKDNATRTHDTDSGNSTNTKNTADKNAERTNGAAVNNARDTQTTSNANTTRTREVGVINAKETLENAQDAVKSMQYDARRKAPVQLTNVSGDGKQMYQGMNGLQFRLRTQSDSAIEQTATQFARYGYNLNQMWNVEKTGLNLMRNFTYWKASDIWVDVRDTANSEIGNIIGNIFKSGVTVWHDPESIGRVDIYDN